MVIKSLNKIVWWYDDWWFLLHCMIIVDGWLMVWCLIIYGMMIHGMMIDDWLFDDRWLTMDDSLALVETGDSEKKETPGATFASSFYTHTSWF